MDWLLDRNWFTLGSSRPFENGSENFVLLYDKNIYDP